MTIGRSGYHREQAYTPLVSIGRACIMNSMPTSLLKTKLFIPPTRPGHISRPRLIERLNAGLHGKLTLLSAPAGFGKTTLLSEWAAHCRRPVAWLSLDEGDNDPARFLAYLVAALQPLQEGLGASILAALRSPAPSVSEHLLIELINEIAAIPAPFVLILDDYHLITAPPIHQALGFLLDHMPPQMHLIIAGRMDPPLPLARLRARNELTELRATDLSFKPHEAAAFLNEIMGLGLSAADVAALDARTEGWIAGLQMAALSMQGRNDLSTFVAAFTGSHRYIMDYLTEEVLEQQPEQMQRFLLETSILNRLCGPLCDALTGRRDGQAMLEALESANLFIHSLDHERRWFRYHRLFADLLQRRLRQTEPDLILTLHRRAFDWYQHRYLHQDAMRHALAAHDFERAADLIQTVGVQMMAQGALMTVQNWITALPPDLVRIRPDLCVLHAWTLTLTNRWDEVEPRLHDAERATIPREHGGDGDVQSPETTDLKGQIAAIRAYEARRHHDFTRSIRLLQKAQALLAADNHIIRTAVNQSLGQAYLFTGKLNEAANAFRTARLLGAKSGNELVGLVATGQHAAILIAQGRLRQAADLCRAAIDRYLEKHEKPSPVLCHPYAFLGQVLYEWNDVEGAVAYLVQSVLWSHQIGYGPYGAPLHLMTALLEWVQLTQETRGVPFQLPEEISIILRQIPAEIDVVDINAWRVRLWLARGELQLAIRWAEARRTNARALGVWPLYRDLAMARVLMARRKYEQALDILGQVRRAAQTSEGRGCQIQALALEALIHQASGRANRALASLAEALTLARPAGFVRTFVDEGPVMAALLRRAAARDIAAEYAGELLSAFPHQNATDKPHIMLVEPLSPRELEILTLIAAGLSNQEIADRLILALGTVKKHTNNIYGKLGVRSRTQAILRAAELGLISSQ